jgi:hypothetical protein
VDDAGEFGIGDGVGGLEEGDVVELDVAGLHSKSLNWPGELRGSILPAA